jgi:bifunctional UDP-N-acetylglucosamine pyrophosphorylase / glucosamine-1-phosphate N-acetyltransferase
MTDRTQAERVAAVVLAAGLGTRFKSDLAKVMHEAAGRTMLRHILAALEPLGLGQVVIVVGHQADEVTTEARRSGIERVDTALQEEQLGTGHAAAQALPVLDDAIEHVIVLPGDTPLLRPETLRSLLDVPDAVDGVLLTAELDDPTGYGRVVRDGDGVVQRIVEEADATEAQRAIREVNVGMYRWRRGTLADAVDRLDEDNAQGEQYLTDVVEIVVASDGWVESRLAPQEDVAGVNDRIALADAAGVIRRRVLERLMAEGVTVIDPSTTYVEVGVEVGRDSTLLPGTILEGETRVGERASIGPYTRLVDTTVGDDADVQQAVGLQAEIGAEVSVGPFAYLRPGTRVERGGKVGTYVELKQTTVGEGAKVPHLSYMGDATIGAGANIGAGTITCNYDGFDKHRTVVGEGAFIGSDTMLIAPVRVGDGAFTGAGSAIAKDVPDDALAVERGDQRNLAGWAAEKRERHRQG